MAPRMSRLKKSDFIQSDDETIISLDLGDVNTAFAVMVNKKILTMKKISIKSSNGGKVIEQRVNGIYKLFEDIKNTYSEHFSNPDKVTIVVEHQVNQNKGMMCVMYAVNMYAKCNNYRLINFPPAAKFSCNDLVCNSTKKQHKKDASAIIANYLLIHEPELHEEYKNSKKKDDLADSIFQMLTYAKVDLQDCIPEGIQRLSKVNEENETLEKLDE